MDKNYDPTAKDEVIDLVVDAFKLRKDLAIDVTDVMHHPEGCIRVELGDKIFHLTVSEIDEDGNFLDGADIPAGEWPDA